MGTVIIWDNVSAIMVSGMSLDRVTQSINSDIRKWNGWNGIKTNKRLTTGLLMKGTRDSSHYLVAINLQ